MSLTRTSKHTHSHTNLGFDCSWGAVLPGCAGPNDCLTIYHERSGASVVARRKKARFSKNWKPMAGRSRCTLIGRHTVHLPAHGKMGNRERLRTLGRDLLYRRAKCDKTFFFSLSLLFLFCFSVARSCLSAIGLCLPLSSNEKWVLRAVVLTLPLSLSEMEEEGPDFTSKASYGFL